MISDTQYKYEFQIPSNWSIKKKPISEDEARFIIQSPNGSRVLVVVGILDDTHTSILKEKNVDKIIDIMIDWTIEQVYKKSYSGMGISMSDVIVGNKGNVSKDNNIQYFIETGVKNNQMLLGLSGLHTIPYNTNYLINILGLVIGDSALKDKDYLKKILNSFHLTK